MRPLHFDTLTTKECPTTSTTTETTTTGTSTTTGTTTTNTTTTTGTTTTTATLGSFQFLCTIGDSAGVWNVFEPDGTNDYIWKFTASQSLLIEKISVQEFTAADAFTGNIWVTDTDAYYPLVIRTNTIAGAQVNSAYTTNLALSLSPGDIIYLFGQIVTSSPPTNKFKLVLVIGGEEFVLEVPYSPCTTE